jgi:5-dehydro-2-deoxygluconokinase
MGDLLSKPSVPAVPNMPMLAALAALQARPLDVLCLGRAGVDLYAVQKNTPLEAVTQFNKSVGGSPANIATAVARLGGRSGVISVVADDGLGRSVVQFLQRNGVDTKGIKTSQNRALTSLALTEIQPTDCQVVIYRQNAADLQLNQTDIDPAQLASSKILLLTGTAFSAEPSRAACFHAMACARASSTQVVLDMDYRPYGWQSEDEAAITLVEASAQCDLLIGNLEEFAVLLRALPAGTGAKDLLTASLQTVIVKNGAQGCEVFTHGGQVFRQGIFRVVAQKPMGSGDAFAGAVLWALCQGQEWPQALACGAAAAAINVSRDTCADAMPSLAELNAFMAQHALLPPD